MHQLGRITPVREHYTVSQLVQCSLNGVTPLSNKPHHDPRCNSHTRHCTRYGTLYLLRDAAPDQNGCTAYVSGASPLITSTTMANGSAPPSQSPIPHTIHDQTSQQPNSPPRNPYPLPASKDSTGSGRFHPIRRG